MRSKRYTLRLGACLLALLAAALPAAAGTDTLRVRLFELSRPTAVEVTSTDGALWIEGAPGSAALSVPAGTPVRVWTAQQTVRAEFGGRSIASERLRLAPAGEALRVRVAEPEGGKPRSYRGVIAIEPLGPGKREMLVLNHVELERYVASVVTSEYPFPEMEGVKAQAVIARTYALRSRGKYGDRYDVADHVGSQVYEGLDRETEISRAAVEATRGEVLLHHGRPIEAVYSSSCGGHTAGNETVWKGRPLPYLRPRPDPYHVGTPHASWRSVVPRKELHTILSAAHGVQIGRLDFSDRSAEGRVLSVTLGGPPVRSASATTPHGEAGPRITANNFRMLVTRARGINSLKSTRFTARLEGDSYVFEGSGFGHGVGFCQWGAREQARKGRDYRSILLFYYEGVELAGNR